MTEPPERPASRAYSPGADSLDLPEVYKDYTNLAQVARDRGDEEAASAWQAKYEAKVAELERLRRGDGSAAANVPQQLLEAVVALAQVAYDVRSRGVELPVEAAEALAQLSGLPEPLGAVGGFLQVVAKGGELPPVPEDLPEALGKMLEELVEAVGR